SSALEFFYDTYGRYPVTAGTPFWDGHWVNFKVCLETGVGCGFSISGTYQPVMIKVPNDPLDKTPDISDNSATYYPPYNGNEKGYVLRAILETNSAAFQTDADGDYYNIGDGLCEDASRYYCIKANWVW
ncbi:MAG TPA: hypothetical protein VGQ87_01610, partial [Patescibacteria group bacterium]|nr:hypothetical protein [Patescibacteria group bacterium]